MKFIVKAKLRKPPGYGTIYDVYKVKRVGSKVKIISNKDWVRVWVELTLDKDFNKLKKVKIEVIK